MTAPSKVTQDQLNYISNTFTATDCGKLLRGEKEAGWLHHTGYLRVKVRGKCFAVSRIMYYLYNGVWPGEFQVDHIDGNKNNNKKENLRLVTHSENQRAFKTPYGHSKYRGVSFIPSTRRWKSCVKMNVEGKKKDFYVGTYFTEEGAALAYNEKALSLGFSREALNVVGDTPHE